MRISDWSSDVCSSDLAGAVDADAFGAEAHRRLHRALHRAAEGDAAFELVGNALRDELRVDLGFADLDDVQRHVAARHRAELLAQLFDVGALLADRSEEHTSELQSLMRISYAVFCLK